MIKAPSNKMAAANRIKIKLNGPLKGYVKGTVLTLPADSNGTPLERYWRDRLRDSAIDHCIEIVPNQKVKRSGASEEESD